MEWKEMKKIILEYSSLYFFLGVLMKGIEISLSYLRVYVEGNGMGRRDHSFLSIPSNPQTFIPSKFGRNLRKWIRFNEFFLLKLPMLLYIHHFILK